MPKPPPACDLKQRRECQHSRLQCPSWLSVLVNLKGKAGKIIWYDMGAGGRIDDPKSLLAINYFPDLADNIVSSFSGSFYRTQRFLAIIAAHRLLAIIAWSSSRRLVWTRPCSIIALWQSSLKSFPTYLESVSPGNFPPFWRAMREIPVVGSPSEFPSEFHIHVIQLSENLNEK